MINLGVPQLIIICIYTLGIGIHLAKDGEPRDGNYSFIINLISTVISAGILWWGGFFTN